MFNFFKPRYRKMGLSKLKAPAKNLQLLELRAGAEWMAGCAMMPLLSKAPRGDGHGVLVLPGFLADDGSTKMLRDHLASLGYKAEGWGMGRNLGPSAGVEEGVAKAVASLCERAGGKVSLVGHSLGGVYARLFAQQSPEMVRLVATLGTPVRGGPKVKNAWRAYEFFTGGKAQVDEKWRLAAAMPKVPSTCVFSRTDGIVAWRASRGPKGARQESVEIIGSHMGMAFNPAVLAVVADRLAQPEGEWRPFDRSGLRALAYPDPYRR